VGRSSAAAVADEVVDAVAAWVGRCGPSAAAVPPTDVAPTRWSDGTSTEEVVRLGAHRLVGVLTEPVRDRRATVLWLNSGSEPHTGPGRAWVEFARDLASDGYASVRLDFSGWGESPDGGRAPGRPYDEHCRGEVVDVVDDLARRGHRRIVVAGLCAGAWLGLSVAGTERIDGVVAVNPQLYWQRGDPVEASIATETRPRRLPEIRRIRRIRGTGAWWLLDALRIRHPAATCLRAVDRNSVEVLALFAEGDDGLEFLEDRVGRSWAHVLRRGRFTLRVIPRMDHPMHRVWRRPAALDAIRDWLDEVFPEGGAGPGGGDRPPAPRSTV